MKYDPKVNDGRLLGRNLLKAKDVASMLNVSLGFAYQLMKQGEIPTLRLGTAVRVRPEDLERYINSIRTG